MIISSIVAYVLLVSFVEAYASADASIGLPNATRILKNVDPIPHCQSAHCGKSKTQGGALIIKMARSGSTWFASLLDRMQRIHIMEEGITHSTGALYNDKQKMIYLINALSGHVFPKKIKYCTEKDITEIGPPGRLGGVYAVTMSPLSSMNVDYINVLKTSHSKLVVYVRTNIVKKSRGEHSRTRCSEILP